MQYEQTRQAINHSRRYWYALAERCGSMGDDDLGRFCIWKAWNTEGIFQEFDPLLVAVRD